MRKFGNKKILITVDHKWRDLPSTMVLKYFLERLYNYKVIICRQGSEVEFCITYLPHCVIFPHILDDSKVEFSKFLNKMGIKLILYPTEGIPSLKRIYEFYSGKFVDMSKIDFQLCWGSGSYDIYREYNTVPKEKLSVIGSSRFDFYFPPLNALLPTKEEIFNKYHFDPNLPLVLWTTNFVKASIYEQNKDAYLSDIKNYKLSSCFPDPDDSALQDIATRSIMLDYLIQISKTNKINLLIKYHPMESPQFYENFKNYFLNTNSFVSIAKDNYIWDLIPYADILVQRSCTTGIEAFLANKPVLEMQVNPKDSYYINEELEGCSDLINDFEQFSQAISYYLSGKSIPQNQLKKRNNFLQKWCYMQDGHSTLRLSRLIHEFLTMQTNTPCRIWSIKTIKYILRNKIYKFIGIPYYIPVRSIFRRDVEIDYLGRNDKWIKNDDVVFWNKYVSTRLDPLSNSEF